MPGEAAAELVGADVPGLGDERERPLYAAMR